MSHVVYGMPEDGGFENKFEMPHLAFHAVYSPKTMQSNANVGFQEEHSVIR